VRCSLYDYPPNLADTHKVLENGSRYPVPMREELKVESSSDLRTTQY